MWNPWQWVQAHVSRLFRTVQPPDRFGTALMLGTSRNVSAPAGWRVVTAANLSEAQSLLARLEIPVVLYDREAPGSDWKRTVRALAGSPAHPSVVLLASEGRLPAWDEVAAAGGYDILREPTNADVLERTLRSARSHWRSLRAIEAGSHAPGL